MQFTHEDLGDNNKERCFDSNKFREVIGDLIEKKKLNLNVSGGVSNTVFFFH